MKTMLEYMRTSCVTMPTDLSKCKYFLVNFMQ